MKEHQSLFSVSIYRETASYTMMENFMRENKISTVLQYGKKYQLRHRVSRKTKYDIKIRLFEEKLNLIEVLDLQELKKNTSYKHELINPFFKCEFKHSLRLDNFKTI